MQVIRRTYGSHPIYKKQPTAKVLASVASEIGKLDLLGADVDHVKRILEPLTHLLVLRTPIIEPGMRFFRCCRISDADQPRELARISYPPASVVQDFQRVNRPGNPVFYASMSMDIALAEGRVASGELVALSEWESVSQLFVTNAGFATGNPTVSSDGRRLRPWDSGTHPPITTPGPNESRTNNEILDYLAELYCRVVREQDAHEYKLTVAISELLGFSPSATISDGSPNEGVREISFDGILYPSTISQQNADNLALRPAAVDAKVRMVSIDWLRIELAEAGAISFKELDFANSLGPAGAIEWKGRPGQWRTRFQGDTLKCTYLGDDRWSVSDVHGNPVDRL